MVGISQCVGQDSDVSNQYEGETKEQQSSWSLSSEHDP
jgi:hypothetical protein